LDLKGQYCDEAKKKMTPVVFDKKKMSPYPSDNTRYMYIEHIVTSIYVCYIIISHSY